VTSLQRYMFDGLARRPDPELAAELHEAYRGAARWVDGLLERTVALLERLGLLHDTLLVVTSDHGEAFGEHGALQHQRWLHEELLRVPLVLRGPAPFDAPQLLGASVGLIDVLPTFFDWAGMLAPPHGEGRSFLPLLLGAAGEHVVQAEEARMPTVTGGASRGVLASARSTRWKYVVTHELLDGSLAEELYDLAADPETRANLLAGGAAAHAVDPDFAAGVERARDRVFHARRRLLPAAPLPDAPRPAPLRTVTR
jgi:arylsulfatase A-like enzyme